MTPALPLTPYQSGDLCFCHSTGIIGRGIRVAEWFRRDWAKTNERTGAKYNHVAILDAPLVNGDWTVIQAEARGVTADGPGHMSRLSTVAPGGSYTVVPLPAGVDRAKVLAFARMQVGNRYGFLSIASILLTLLTPTFINVMVPDTWICSAVTAESARCGGWLHSWSDIYQVSPAQLWCALQ